MIKAVDVTGADKTAFKYSVCTFVTRPQKYQCLLESMAARGFDASDCEFLYIDNSESNKYDAFAGTNKFLAISRGEYIILCHQDIVLLSDDRNKLDDIIRDLDRIDPQWGLFGNAGGVVPGRLALRISDPHGEDQRQESLPIRVSSLDENFIVVRKDANLALSHDLHGFHLYGTELCLIADILGMNAYVVDFHLRHLSGGGADGLAKVRNDMITKYQRALRSRIIKTPSAILVLRGRVLLTRVLNSRVSVRAMEYFYSMAKRLK